MYQDFYSFTGMPFQITPDAKFFFNSSNHSRAISHLIYGLSQQEGFIVITGDVGAGKTTLVEQMRLQLKKDSYNIARIYTTQVSHDDLLSLTASAFGIQLDGHNKTNVINSIEKFLISNHSDGKRSLLIVDEVQSLSISALEELRMLSNITKSGKAVLQTILLGQPEFRKILTSQDLDQLRQRVLASYHLGPLSLEETKFYIEHRLKTVGWSNDPVWEDQCFISIFKHTLGVPRRINRLCSRILLYGAIEEIHVLTSDMVEMVALELENDLLNEKISNSDFLPESVDVLTRADVKSDYLDIIKRLELLEESFRKRENSFQRIMNLLEGISQK
jgi:putative secretion ATPase (PEP-CTERM system associated)